MRTSRQNSAFTLFELLVILIVIAFLVCALLPVLARTSQDSNAVQCLNNFRQLMNAWKMYSDDYQGKLVPNRTDTVPGNWVKGFMDFSSSSDNTNINNLIGSNALIGVYVRSAIMHRCGLCSVEPDRFPLYPVIHGPAIAKRAGVTIHNQRLS